MNNQEQFFATCGFCQKPEQLIVFDCAWKGRKTHDNRWIKGGRIWLCSKCCFNYQLEHDNHDYNLAVEEMCSTLDIYYMSDDYYDNMIKNFQISDNTNHNLEANYNVKQEVIIIK